MDRVKPGGDKRNRIKIILVSSLIIIIISVFLGYKYYEKGLGPVSINNGQVIKVEVPLGSSPTKIGEILYDKDLINSKLVFKYRLKKLGLAEDLKAGNYELSQSMKVDEIIKALTEGGKADNTVRFTVPEGYELQQIGERLAEDGLVDLDRFMELAGDKKNFEDEFEFLKELDQGQSLEGFLFPSTYEVYKDAKEEEIISRMLKQFEEVYNTDIKDRMADLGMSLNEIITMASLVEREARVEEERPLIAGVYYKRLDIGMKLQCDATVQYALGERKERLLYKDLEIDSPYNTYLHYGLPIGPISSVGKASIQAALYPEETDYLYYVARDDGSHIFTKTLEEHNKAKKEALGR